MKFLYIFLFNLLVLNDRNSFNARLLDYQPLMENIFKIETSELEELNNPYLRKTMWKDLEGRKKREAGKVYKSELNFNKVTTKTCKSLTDYRNQLFNSKNTADMNRIPEKADKKRFGAQKKIRRRRRDIKKDKKFIKRFSRETRRYLDYTNSQMPFNEGNSRHKDFQKNVCKEGKKTWKNLEQKQSCDGFEGNLKMKISVKERLLRSLKEHFPDLKNKIPGDDILLEYSRVRRFLDQGKIKKRDEGSITLEEKEAAMSMILDPNLNLEGILEPHVRKRRDKFIIKHRSGSHTIQKKKKY